MLAVRIWCCIQNISLVEYFLFCLIMYRSKLRYEMLIALGTQWIMERIVAICCWKCFMRVFLGILALKNLSYI